jgi:F-type H+-transporting ATPase subunit epsilon
MNEFTLHLQGATQYETIDHVRAFVGEDGSGSFSLLAGHAHFVTTLVFGLARLRLGDGQWEYLALPGAVARFADNALHISTRRFLRGGDYTRIVQALRAELLAEEQDLRALKTSFEQMEQEMLRRLWRIGRGEEGRM